jgi:DNA-binding Lrp family transcriptional regulator
VTEATFAPRRWRRSDTRKGARAFVAGASFRCRSVPCGTCAGADSIAWSPTLEVQVLQAYILVQTEVGKAAQVAKEVRNIAGVTEAEDVTGPYDIIVRAEAKDVDELGKLVLARIQSAKGTTRTLTCPVIHL